MGVWRRLKNNHSNQVARRLVFLHTSASQDVAGDGSRIKVERFRSGYAVFGRYDKQKLTRRKDLAFVEPGSFWNVLHARLSPKHTTWIFGHSIFRQLTNLDFWSQFEDNTVNLDAPRRKRLKEGEETNNAFGYGYCVLSNPPLILGARHIKTGGRMIIVDSLNWFSASLADLGAAANVEFFDKFDTAGDIADTIEHCRTGAVILQNTFVNLIKWLQDNELGVMKYTAAQQSMSAYRHKRMTHDIFPHDVADAKDLERASYFGGQTEVYRPGPISERVYQLDVNSLYPYVMLNGRFPTKLIRWRIGKGELMESIRSNLSDSIARVSVSDVENTYPARIDNRLHYIKGYDTYVLAGPELMHLVAHSKLHGVYDFSTYQTEPIFTKFVTEMWAMRKKYKEEGNELFDRFVKLIMNSLYGKFAQKSPQWEPMPDMYDDRAFVQWPHIDLTTKKTTYFRSIGYNVEKMVDRVEKAGSFIAISSFITSYAREYMRGIRQAAGPRNVFYQGVDSVIVNRAGHNNLYMAGVIDQSELGKLKLQGVYETGNLHGMNDYEIGEKTVRSGMKDTAVMLPDGSFQQDEWSGVTSLFKQGKATITISETHKRRV